MYLPSIIDSFIALLCSPHSCAALMTTENWNPYGRLVPVNKATTSFTY